MRKILVTGSGGLIGSSVVRFFSDLGFAVTGIDNDMRQNYFGAEASIQENLNCLIKEVKNYDHYGVDIRNAEELLKIFKDIRPELVVHCAAQPSHDLAAQIPLHDFHTNANGTLNLLEAARNYTKESPFVFLSTNKVYGDNPNKIVIQESKTRWQINEKKWEHGIDETMSIDHCVHSLFGVSKTSADLLVQEYGRYFSMPTVCLRGGCLTGEDHMGIGLHGFLSFLVKTNVFGLPYTIIGYKGKQVRDNIHATDVSSLIYEYYKSPRVGEVYNIGGGYSNSISVLEAINLIEGISGNKQSYDYDSTPRVGDHICYYTNLSKVKKHYPSWKIKKNITQIVEAMVMKWKEKLYYTVG